MTEVHAISVGAREDSAGGQRMRYWNRRSVASGRRRAPQQPRVLVVEDDAMIALASRLRLEELGFEVVGAVASGPDAIAQCERTNVDMVLMDVRLRGAMDGIEAARRIISRHAVSILFVSAYTSRPETLQRIQEIGDFPVLSKPYTDESFKDAVVHLAECEGGPGRPS